MRLETHALTSRGGRRINEDALKEVTGPGFTVLALADGLGGHGGGELAARECVAAIAAGFGRAPGLSDSTLQALVDEADRTVAALRRERQEPASAMRTTLALLAVCDDRARWAHVGDSRVYWFRGGELLHRTRDHSVAELVTGLRDSSLAAPPDDADRHRLLRVVGAGEGCRAELGDKVVALEPGDAFLLCTDGVWSIVPDAEIATSLLTATSPRDWADAVEERLRERLRVEMPEGQDNYSMICGMVAPA